MTDFDLIDETIAEYRRFERARARFDTEARREYGVTGSHLSLLRLIDKKSPIPILQLRKELGWQPATIGQAVKRLVRDELISIDDDPEDLRRRLCSITEEGRRFLLHVPLTGPARLRTYEFSEEELTTMKRGFETALKAFGYVPWSDED
ncbi:MarR family winged helix-turn-helix transcriptional regulator [Corynebacterium aurimucosum]|uniref:MarR family winged helix-turn-helix transcriptional regulator n=1 Tax=Corynebacterium aurimucosum TaxID=169292 RepID=UPI0039907BBE